MKVPLMPSMTQSYLGAAASVLITAEMARNRILPAEDRILLGTFSDLDPYILRRWDYEQDTQLPEILVPERFRCLFRTRATQRTNFIKYSAALDP
jgi:hypothetical protein